ncbi:DUF3175 domain-containing protein [Jongsikchunia kroppenstedtii]|uniref:DUF3175 domain-containing protein n=1 Tax=Jongsikchunia kroppenstedtii TaxID=1121721 RepID=UPI000373760A|nr:DUF3175 domain-containing protein [Jongsikchunia kroppenstedtii]
MAEKKEKWSQDVTEHSDALDLDDGVFTWSDPKRIARSLLESAEDSNRRKATSPYRSAMSMLTFYINRAGDGLSKERREVLDLAKDELRALHEKDHDGE